MQTKQILFFCLKPAMSPPTAIKASREYGKFQPASFEMCVSGNGSPKSDAGELNSRNPPFKYARRRALTLPDCSRILIMSMH